MIRYKVPLKKPKPDIRRFLDAMSGKSIPDKVPMVEYLIDNAVMKPILENMMGRTWVDTSDKTEYMGGQMDFSRENLALIDAWLDNQIAFWTHMGYDFIRVEVSLPLPAAALITRDTARGNEEYNRAWQGLHEGPIKNWEDFEKYPWPEIGDDNFYIHRYICGHLPEGLGFITCHAGGVYEHTSRLLGFENLCYLMYDNPALLKAVADRLGELILRYNHYLLKLEGLAAIFQGEDFGYNTQTLIPPEAIRKHFLPWHKLYAERIHESGKPYYFHSCGEISAIMEDLIGEVKIDGKHSFQDNVLPAAQAKKLYGDRICILGGIDVDKLASFRPDDLRRYVREVIDQCAPGGRFAVGAGNSIPSYIPVESYLTMLDEALQGR
jgi:uroporphyrinogen decarboxylase